LESKSKIKIGVIADDFTGAGDAASFLIKNGAKTILLTNITEEFHTDCECIVVALKARSVEPEEAIRQSKEAVDFFKKVGVKCIYFKYCSTFDSTPKGNIGVVLDFLLDYLDVSYTLICPSLPVNGRRVEKGILYVNGIPLSESPMKNHPLNPMWDSYIPALMKDQSKNPCYIVTKEDMANGNVQTIINECLSKNQKFYIVPDYNTEEDGKMIGQLFNELPVLSGGSGLLEYLLPPKEESLYSNKVNKKNHRSIILCGSCSKMTKKQIDRYRSIGGLTFVIDSKKLLNKTLCAKDIFDCVLENENETMLIYSDAVDKDMSELSKSDSFQIESKLIETLMADLSELAKESHFGKIIVAGGETSGAVTIKLGYSSYYIGETVAPGVPTMIPLDNDGLELILKSGNFGKEDFFEKAIGKE
jgi:3-dehydrotetronate 4-kinase